MKSIVFVVFILINVSLFSNIVYPEIISEIYFEGDDWFLELSNSIMSSFIQVEPNEILFECSGGEAYLNLSTFLIYNACLVVDQSDFSTILPLNKEGDYLEIESEELCEIHYWGNYPNSHVTQLYPGQSYVNCVYNNFMLVKQNTETLGYNPYHTYERGIFSGHVYDANMSPLENAQICYRYYENQSDSTVIISDENGYFEDANMFACNYYINLYYNGNLELSSQINIEPDSTTYEEFILENVKVTNNEIPTKCFNLTNFPNPFNPTTEISFNLTTNSHEFTRIEIYNSKGQKVKTIACHPEFIEGRGLMHITWNGDNENGKSCPSGVYLYKLVSGDKVLAANKMLLLK